MTVGIDLGGTKIAAALVDAAGGGVNACEVRTPTEGGPKAVIGAMVEGARRVMAGRSPQEIQGVGVGSPGPLDFRSGVVLAPPNLPGWEGIPLRDDLSRALGMDVLLANDASAATLAECRLGAGVGVKDMVYLTLSTGIGGGVIVDGRLRQGATGSIAEVGHQVIDIHGPACACGNYGCLEAMASGAAIRRMARERMGADLTAEEVAVRAGGGDRRALAILDDVYRYLGTGIVNVVQMFDPALIVVGGGLSRIGRPLFDALQSALDANPFRGPHALRVQVVPAKLGQKAGVIGAALLPVARAEGVL